MQMVQKICGQFQRYQHHGEVRNIRNSPLFGKTILFIRMIAVSTGIEELYCFELQYAGRNIKVFLFSLLENANVNILI